MKLRLYTYPPPVLAFAWLGGFESLERTFVTLGGGAPAVIVMWLGIMAMITVHEFGHWTCARLFGMLTPVFSIGFGSREHSWPIGYWANTEWRIGWIPFGGFVSLPELADESVTAGKFENLRVFPAWQRIIVLFAGPAFNIISAAIMVFGIYAYDGQPMRELRTDVVELSTSITIARDAGVQVEDRIVSVGGEKVSSPNDYARFIIPYKSKPVPLVLDRGGVSVPIFVTPDGDGRIGIGLIPIVERVFYKKPLGETIYLALVKTKETFFGTVEGLGIITHILHRPASLSGKDPELRGLIYMVQVGAEAYQSGMFNFIWNMVLVSMGIAVLNLMPIPGLDGGHITFCVIEALRGMPLAESTNMRARLIGMSLVLCLIGYGLFNDFKHIVMNLNESGFFNKVAGWFA